MGAGVLERCWHPTECCQLGLASPVLGTQTLRGLTDDKSRIVLKISPKASPIDSLSLISTLHYPHSRLSNFNNAIMKTPS